MSHHDTFPEGRYPIRPRKELQGLFDAVKNLDFSVLKKLQNTTLFRDFNHARDKAMRAEIMIQIRELIKGSREQSEDILVAILDLEKEIYRDHPSKP